MSDPALYEIEHFSRYVYLSPVRHSVSSLCLQPRDDDGQRLLRFDVATKPPAPVNSETDYFGNTKQVLNIHREHQELEIASRSLVERNRASSLPDSMGADAWEEIRSWKDSFGYWEFTHPSAFAQPSDALTAFVDELDIKAGGDPLESLLRLSDTLYRGFQYVPGSSTVASPIEQILKSRRGVCQDYAHVMIAIARSWHVPARYVSGYLYMDGEGEEEARQTAMHAWVECRLPDLGWIGFDPTNRCLADQLHVRVAVGRDYRDVAPIRGVFEGGREARMDVEVRVRAGRHDSRRAPLASEFPDSVVSMSSEDRRYQQ